MPTHEVTNQVPPYGGHDVFASDPVVAQGVDRWVPDEHLAVTTSELSALGRLAGSAEAAELADRAQRNIPRLMTHDRWGHRIDEVEFDPAWHALMGHATAAGLTAVPWTRPQGSGAHVARAAGFLTWSQVEPGTSARSP